MNNLRGLPRLQAAMADFSAQYIDPALKARRDGEALRRPTDAAFAAVFVGFIEVTAALDALSLVESLIGLAPPRSKKVQKDEYLKFLISSYLQEVYILEQRLRSYATKVGRMYHKPGLIKAAEQVISESFGGLTMARGAHVHARRFSDEGLDRLASLALVSRFKPEFVDDTDFEYQLVRQRWRRQVTANNEATKNVLDAYCDMIFVCITKTNKIFLPPTGRAAVRARVDA